MFSYYLLSERLSFPRVYFIFGRLDIRTYFMSYTFQHLLFNKNIIAQFMNESK